MYFNKIEPIRKDDGNGSSSEGAMDLGEIETSNERNIEEHSPQHFFPRDVAERHQILHGIIKADNRYDGKRLESHLRNLAEQHNFGGRNQTGILSIHTTRWHSHLHWIHICKTFQKGSDCSCHTTKKIRSLGFGIKWRRIKWSREWERNCIIYLSEEGRQVLQASIDGNDELEKCHRVYNYIKAIGQPGREESSLRCEISSRRGRRGTDGSHQPGGEDSEDSDAGSSASGYSRRSTGKTTWSMAKQKAKELDDLLCRKFLPSYQAMLEDEEYREIMSHYFYDQDDKREKIGKQVWDDFCIKWRGKSLRQIIIERINSEFNLRKYYSPKYSLQIIVSLLRKQSMPYTFIQDVVDIIDMNRPKVNTLYIKGQAGAGKTYFLNSLADLVWSVGYVEANVNRNNNFPFENLIWKRMAILNEFNCSKGQKDSCKELFEGTTTTINIKHKSRMSLPRTPCFITTNNNFLLNFEQIDSNAFKQRMIIYSWSSQPWLKELDAYPHPLIWAKLITLSEEEYKNLPEPDLSNQEYDLIISKSTVTDDVINQAIKDIF